ncbi:uncharacterized protein VNE69_03192 [Vairimorpha necatrix]|uniref:Uncharacterized protein n=1 Tax=Vairimorpha necatrix TaxID=6039 RepID=A0AAX4JAI6_9MICR
MLKINFPFLINEFNTSLKVKTNLERKENLVTFSLEYKMIIKINNSKCISIQKCGDVYVYVFEFEKINDAIDFIEIKECEVTSSSFFSDPKEIEQENVEYAEIYVNSGGAKKKQKKRLVEDENGFQRYI